MRKTGNPVSNSRVSVVQTFASGVGHLPDWLGRLLGNIEKNSFLVGILVVSLFVIPFAPLIVLGEGAYVRVWDEASFNVWRVILARSGKIFADSLDVVPNLMGGLPRLSFESEFKLPILLYFLLPPFPAYVADNILVRAIAFFGMYFLVRGYVLPERPFYAKLCAVTFAALPFFVFQGVGVAGQPLLVYAALRFREDGWRWSSAKYVLPFALFPFYSNITGDGLYLLAAGGLAFLLASAVRRQIEYTLLLLLVVMTAAYAVADYRLVMVGLGLTSFEPHRQQFIQQGFGSYEGIRRVWMLLTDGYETSRINADTGVWAAIVLYAGSSLLFGLKVNRRLVGVIAALVGCAVASAFVGTVWWRGARHLFPGFLATIELQRLYQLLPLLAYVAFSLSLAGLVRLGDALGVEAKAGERPARPAIDLDARNPIFGAALPRMARFYALLPPILLAVQFAHNCLSSPQYAPYFKPGYARENFFHAKYASFVETELFRRIKEHIGRDQSSYRVASLGLEPEIAALNGFYTVDGYALLYPLDYKKRFRKVIGEELERYPDLQSSFDTWGGKAYVFSGELKTKSGDSKYMVPKARNIVIDRLGVDTAALRALGAEYVLSAVEIHDATNLGLRLEKLFDREGSLYRVFLYRVDKAVSAISPLLRTAG